MSVPPVRQAVSELVASLLWEHSAIKVRSDEPFRLSSGNYTPLYVNCRLLLSHPSTADLLSSLFHLRCEDAGIDPGCVAGGETGGIAFGAWVAQRLNKPFVYIRRKTKGYGTGSRIEGVPVGEVLLVEDMVTDGGTKLGFIEAIREIGHDVAHCLIVLDRLQGAGDLLIQHGVRLHALTDIRTCLDLGVREGLCARDTQQVVHAYLNDARGWHAKQGLVYTDALATTS